MSSTDATTSDVPLVGRLTGQVKWFNNKAGYGFITVNVGEHSGKDIFIHYSAIRVVNSQYKFLVQGEYVEFDLVKSTSESHEYQALDISGINGGQLMCEARRQTTYHDNNNTQPRQYNLGGGRGYNRDRDEEPRYRSRDEEPRYRSRDEEPRYRQRDDEPRPPALSRQPSVSDNGYTKVQRKQSKPRREESAGAQ